MNKTKIAVGLLMTLSLLSACSGSDGSIENPNDSIKDLSQKDARTELTSYVKKIDAKTGNPKRDIDSGNISESEELPDVNTSFPLSVEGVKGTEIAEIFVSSEKAGNGKDGLYNDLANQFNKENKKVNGKTVSVAIRPMPSGTGLDYIKTKNHVPAGFTPSNTQWGYMMTSNGVKSELVAERTVGNTGGLLMKKELYDEMTKKYGQVDMSALVKAVNDDGKLLGYTNPYTSSTGLSLLTQLMCHFDKDNPLGENAVNQLKAFQTDLPSTFINTPQLREVAKNGSADIMSISYQTYINTPEFAQYKYVPMGIRHDSPMYTFDSANDEAREVVKEFTKYVTNDENQSKASDYGFNQLNDYKFNDETKDGALLTSIQQLWKENKNGGKPIVAVFVADISGSMEGAPIASLKKSLLNSSKYIGSDSQIGLVSYSSDVTIELPIAPMDTNQRGLFTGAVKGLSADGGTHTYNATLVALDMIEKQMKKTPDARPIIFVLSDGESNGGYSLDKVAPIIKSLGVSINTIGYNEDIAELSKLSSINESASIKADNDNVAYQLKQLFNAEL